MGMIAAHPGFPAFWKTFHSPAIVGMTNTTSTMASTMIPATLAA
jgi:hypothetical protein